MPDIAISPAGLRIVKLLVGHPPQTVADLTRAAGVTRTAVTEQLNELMAAGFVERTDRAARPAAAGRATCYKATDAALVLLFAGNQRWWCRPCGEPSSTWAARSMAKKIRQTGQPRDGRPLQPQDHGQEAARTAAAVDRPCWPPKAGWSSSSRTDDGQWTLPKRSCPFHQHGRRPPERLPHRPGNA